MSETLRIFQVDAFTQEPFKGNPAAVCLLSHEYDDALLRAVAAEMNLSETAFVIPLDAEDWKMATRFSLRWFTPLVEVRLCGHATLATGAVLLNVIKVAAPCVAFETLSGELVARRDAGGGVVLDFPADPPQTLAAPTAILEALGCTHAVVETLYAPQTQKLLVCLEEEAQVRALVPDYGRLKTAPAPDAVKGVIVTAPSQSLYDFISRYFAPWVGINEDPVTGSAHTVLAPYWAKRLAKTALDAYQASARGGTLHVRLVSDTRVELVGHAVVMLEGILRV